MLHKITLRGARAQDGGAGDGRAVVSENGSIENSGEAQHGDEG